MATRQGGAANDVRDKRAPRMMGTHPAGMISSKAKTAPANAPDEMKCSPCHSRSLGAGATYTPRSLLRHHSAHSLASASSIASEGFLLPNPATS